MKKKKGGTSQNNEAEHEIFEETFKIRPLKIRLEIGLATLVLKLCTDLGLKKKPIFEFNFEGISIRY